MRAVGIYLEKYFIGYLFGRKCIFSMNRVSHIHTSLETYFFRKRILQYVTRRFQINSNRIKHYSKDICRKNAF